MEDTASTALTRTRKTTARVRSAVFWALVSLTAFQALSAVGGGVGVLATDGLGMPLSLLAGGLFATFMWPGLILLVVVGGTQSVALWLLLERRKAALLWTATAGFGMLIWIFVETGILGGTSWLQILYFATGTAQVALVIAMLGAVGWRPRIRRARSSTG